MTDVANARRRLRTAVVWDGLRAALDARLPGREALEVLDVGGGTGGFAVPLAQAGHAVTVLDPNPDALAALERRAAEAGVGDRVRWLQADAPV
jgi:ubiquinone/menaquinone biosynthesis C-methylase UbiE